MWLPVFLAYYPGLFAYDIHGQIPQKIGSYSTHHPLLHTLYMQFFYFFVGKASSYTFGIAVAIIVQMAVFSLMFSFTHLYLRRIGICARWRIFLIVLTGILPVFSMLAISATKDIFFSISFGMLFTLLCYDLSIPKFIKGKSRYDILYVLSATGSVMFRNNGIYCVLALVLFLAAKSLLHDKKNSCMLSYTLMGLLLGISLSLALKIGLQAAPGTKNEILNLPYQQLARTYAEHQDSLPQKDVDAIRAILPSVEYYNPHKSDEVKWMAAGPENMGRLVSLYFRLGLRYPLSYLDAFFLLNAGYLGVTDVSFARIYGTDNRQGIFLTDTKGGFDIRHRTFFAPLENLYEKLYTSDAYENVFPLNLLCSPAFYFWIICLLALYAIICKNTGALPLFVLAGTYILTALAGPCVLPRYALSYIVCIIPMAACLMKMQAKGK